MNNAQPHRPASLPAIIVGGLLVATAILGLCYNAMTAYSALLGAFEPLLQQQDVPYFYQAFFAMSGICIFSFLVLIACGIDLIRSRFRWTGLVTAVLLLEVGYFFAVGSLWHEPTIGPSVAAATGVANGGLMPQFLILLPLWAPLALWWAKSKQQPSEDAQDER